MKLSHTVVSILLACFIDTNSVASATKTTTNSAQIAWHTAGMPQALSLEFI